MNRITIPDVDDNLQRRLEARAAKHGRSIEAEAHNILRSALDSVDHRGIASGNLGDAIRAIVEPIGGIELDIPSRKVIREPPRFE